MGFLFFFSSWQFIVDCGLVQCSESHSQNVRDGYNGIRCCGKSHGPSRFVGSKQEVLECRFHPKLRCCCPCPCPLLLVPNLDFRQTSHSSQCPCPVPKWSIVQHFVIPSMTSKFSSKSVMSSSGVTIFTIFSKNCNRMMVTM